MKLLINGQELEAYPGESVLQVARRAGIFIPTLCFHEAFGGQGSCRLCTVEITVGGRTRLAASCTFPASEGIEVRTSTPALEQIRRNIIMLLYKRAPNSEFMQELYRKYGGEDNSLEIDPSERCILCGLCVLACREMGTGAIATVMRGTEKRVGTPYDEGSPDCIGCAACARICPTGAIQVQESGDERVIWNRTFALISCQRCGQVFATADQVKIVAARTGIDQDIALLCDHCRRQALAQKLAR